MDGRRVSGVCRRELEAVLRAIPDERVALTSEEVCCVRASI